MAMSICFTQNYIGRIESWNRDLTTHKANLITIFFLQKKNWSTRLLSRELKCHQQHRDDIQHYIAQCERVWESISKERGCRIKWSQGETWNLSELCKYVMCMKLHVGIALLTLCKHTLPHKYGP